MSAQLYFFRREPSPNEINYNCIQGWSASPYPGIGNIDLDPQFTNSLVNDFSLKPGSPCIDAGDNLAVPAGILTDLANRSRFFDDPATPDTGVPGGAGGLAIVDMGAFEFDGHCHADIMPQPSGNFMIDIDDLLAVIGDWGMTESPADIAPPGGDGAVNIDDLLAVIAAWGPCP